MTGGANDGPLALIHRAKQGDRDAAGNLLQQYEKYLSLLARLEFPTRLQARIDASDLVQDTFMLAAKDIGQFQGNTEKEFMAWLRRIMANTAAGAVRHHSRQARDVGLERKLLERFDQSSLLIQNAMISPDSSPSHKAQRKERSAILAELLAELPADYREVLILRQLEGLSMREVAARMGRSSDSVNKLFARGVVKLRELMRRYDA